jgi:hypothetical protein
MYIVQKRGAERRVRSATSMVKLNVLAIPLQVSTTVVTSQSP